MRVGPEEHLQRKVARFLDEHLPPDVMWTATAISFWLPPQMRVRLRACGLRPGWTDLSFALPTRGVRLIELKVDDAESSLKAEQKRLRDILQPLGHWARAKSVEEVAAALEGWGVRLEESAIWRR